MRWIEFTAPARQINPRINLAFIPIFFYKNTLFGADFGTKLALDIFALYHCYFFYYTFCLLPFLHPFEADFRGGAPNPALPFSLQKSKQKASTPGSYKIYFYTGILQLPTVGQVKCLYTPLKINFIDGFKGVRLTATARQKTKANGNSKS